MRHNLPQSRTIPFPPACILLQSLNLKKEKRVWLLLCEQDGSIENKSPDSDMDHTVIKRSGGVLDPFV